MDKLILRFVTFFFTLLLITSCGGDDNDISGIYELYSYQSASCDDAQSNRFVEVDDSGCSDINGFEVCLSGNLTLTSDNTFTIVAMITSAIFSTDVTGSGEYTSLENTITICDGLDCLDGSINGDEITVSIPSDDGCILTVKGRR